MNIRNSVPKLFSAVWLIAFVWLAFGAPRPACAQSLIGYWDFNDASAADTAKDKVAGYTGTFENGVVYTADSGGRSATAGDRAVDFGTTSAQRAVRISDFSTAINAAALGDMLTVSVWVKWSDAPVNSSAFWFVSEFSSGGSRGIQAHVPYGAGGTVYFDTAGCCTANTQRLSGTPAGVNWQQWHHLAFVKNAGAKEVWLDGVRILNGTGANPLPDDFTDVLLGLDNSNTANQHLGLLDDFAVFASALDSASVDELARGTSPLDLQNLNADTDGDGMPGLWEQANGFNNNDPTDAAQDADEDGLTNLQEYQKTTDPRDPDSDDDGLKDGVETGTGAWTSATDTGTDPLNPDMDGDQLKDGVETNTGVFVSATDTGTDPFVADTDGDGFSDSTEIALGSSPVNPNSIPPSLGTGLKLFAYWDFNDATVSTETKDKTHNFVGTLVNGAAFTPDAGGRSGAAGDLAVTFGTSASSGRSVRSTDIAPYLQLAASGDQMTVVFWQKWNAPIRNGSAVWMRATSIGSGERGWQSHAPYGNGTFYFDTGRGGLNTYNRISGNPITSGFDPGLVWQDWHHIALVKNAGTKQIWIDGRLFLEGPGNDGEAPPLPTDLTELILGMDFSNLGNTALITMDEFAIFASALEPLKITALSFGVSPRDIEAATGDTDGDGLPDFWEDQYGLNKASNADASQDSDADGLTNLQEYEQRTHPKNADTDDDGANDGAEIAAGTQPLNPDSDGDGLKDGAETNTGVFVSATNTGTNPLERDSDGDGYSDAAEVLLGSSPVNLNSVPITPGALNLLAYWNFNDDSAPSQALDAIHGWVGELRNGAVYTANQGGRSGKSGDRAVDMGTASASGRGVRVAGAYWLNGASVPDTITVSYWQKWNVAVANSSAFWMVSPSSSGNQRGAHAETTWGNGNIVWDTGGCCDAATQRLLVAAAQITEFDPALVWQDWHHIAFVKNLTTKQIWIDGSLLIEGENSNFLPLDFTALYLGVEPSGANNMRGLIDEFAVYASALDQQKIDLLARGASPINFEFPVDPPAFTKIQRSGGNLVLEWDGGGTLETTDKVIGGTWTSTALASPASIPESTLSGIVFVRVRR